MKQYRLVRRNSSKKGTVAKCETTQDDEFNSAVSITRPSCLLISRLPPRFSQVHTSLPSSLHNAHSSFESSPLSTISPHTRSCHLFPLCCIAFPRNALINKVLIRIGPTKTSSSLLPLFAHTARSPSFLIILVHNTNVRTVWSFMDILENLARVMGFVMEKTRIRSGTECGDEKPSNYVGTH